MSRVLTAALLAALVLLGLASSASGAWRGDSAGAAYTKAASLGTGAQPSAAVSGRNVELSWSASSGTPVDGYLVKRYNGSGQEQTIGANCSGTISGTSCVEKAVPPGTWRYSITPVRQNWRGAESPLSAPAVVGAPALSLNQSSVSSLPATVSGQISDFIDGQSVTFRLDDPNTGQILSGSINPNPVPYDGTAQVSVTLPAGTASGQRTVYAIGNQGDVAGAAITVVSATQCQNPGTVTLSANRDSYVNQASADQNYGIASDLFVESKGTNQNRRTLVGFNLPSVPTGCTVTDATLRLFSTAAITGRTLDAFRAAGAWTETGVSWNNQPATAGAAASAASGTGWRAWAVTPQVVEMYGGTNHGFLIRDRTENATAAAEQKFDSRENINRPQLLLTFG
jgi:hypothetical protein